MENALGQPQTVVLLGGSSEIGLAIVRALASPALRTVVLACRDVAKGEQAAIALHEHCAVDVVPFDGDDVVSHQGILRELAARHGDLDVVVVAFAVLGDPAVTTHDAAAAAAVAHTNVTGVIAATVAAGEVLRAQGHGSIVMLSSVAAERVRAANPVYGGTKAGIDGFAQGYGDALRADGVHMLVVRPGFVHSAMTAGLPAAPFATTPDAVGSAVAAALRKRRRVVWVPGILRFVFMTLRHLPGPVWRRLPLG
jgi:decaprenylphospho-beta-D-erythro-pentofuranosid-2-ulose 2-reductase